MVRNPRSLEAWMMLKGKQGQVFYSIKPDRHLTATAINYNRKIKTERMTVIQHGSQIRNPTAKYITKVTLL